MIPIDFTGFKKYPAVHLPHGLGVGSQNIEQRMTLGVKVMDTLI